MADEVYQESVIVFNEKERDRVFLVRSLDEQYAVALRVIAERYNDGHWYSKVAECEGELHKVELLLEQLKGVESSDNRLEQLRTSLHSSVDSLNKHLVFLKDLVKAVTEKNGAKAWQLLEFRKDRPYERVALLPLEVL